MTRGISALLLAALAACAAPPPDDGWRLSVLGVAQDGGVPHIGCTKPPCSTGRVEKVACLGLAGPGGTYLFDATPDLPAQLRALTGGPAPDGIFLTHAHIGHYSGLMYLGKEALGARAVPVYATPRMAAFLAANEPWKTLVTDGRIDLRTIDGPVTLPGGVTVTAVPVPHRDELSDTVGYFIEGPRARAIFVPDADRWPDGFRELIDGVDHAFLDGTFSSADELPHRDVTKIPHPLIPDTRERLRGVRAKVWFIHLNHSNPAFGEDDVVREGMKFPM